MKTRHAHSTLLVISTLFVAGCGANPEQEGRLKASAAALVQTCTAQNVGAYPYSGTLCGGSVIDGCSPGALYSCTGGPLGTTNNCTLSSTCSVGCLTGNNSTPVSANTTAPQASDACYTGTAPLTLSSSSIVGGNNVTLTATLAQTHTPYAIVNLNGLNNMVAQPCNVPVLLPSNVNSISLTQPTATVTSTSQVPLWTLISYTDSSSNKTRNLVSLATPLTLQPGGSVVIPPLASFIITNGSGTPISTIPGGSNAFTQGTLSGPAPFGGAQVTVTTSPAGAFTTDGSFTINAACTSNSSWGLLTATSTATSNIAATVTASGAGSPLSANVTVIPPPLAIQSVTLSPSTLTGGNTSTATVTLNRAVISTDPTATVSIRVSEGLLSGTQLATFSGCTGSPACTGTATVPAGASSVSVTLSTTAVTTQDLVTVAASASWSTSSASANLTINPGACTPATCSSLGFNCGSASDGCGGTLSCGTCSNGQTCTNNVCTGSGSVTLSALTLNPGRVKGGNSSTGTVTLSGAAPNGGAAVSLSSSNTRVATVPSSVTIAAGATSASFTVSTQQVRSNTTVTISGTYNGSTQSAVLTVTSR